MSINLDAIQARADAATEGPWASDSYEVIARPYLLIVADVDLHMKDEQATANGAFIAAARTDVPALLAHAWELEARNDKARELHRPITHHFLTPPAGSLEVCEACRWEYPCPTVAALTATEGQA